MLIVFQCVNTIINMYNAIQLFFIGHIYLKGMCVYRCGSKNIHHKSKYLKGVWTTTPNYINYSSILITVIIPTSVCYYSKLHGVVTI